MGILAFGGVKRIAKTAEVLVPLMAIGYLVVCFIILIFNIDAVPGVFSVITYSAFGTESTFGGIVGSAIT